MSDLKHHFLICQCSSSEHTLQFICDPDEKEIYTQVFLNQHRSFFKRVWVSIKYIFGYKCRYGHWDTFIMRSEDLEKIKVIIEDMH